jgi:hypothetical protein
MARTRDDDDFDRRDEGRHRLHGRHNAIQFADNRQNGNASS